MEHFETEIVKEIEDKQTLGWWDKEREIFQSHPTNTRSSLWLFMLNKSTLIKLFPSLCYNFFHFYFS